MLPINFKVFCC